MAKLVSPLRYPGGKADLCFYIEKFIDENQLEGCHIIEPYAGSAIISLDMLSRGKASKATLVEKDPLIYAFWHSVFWDTERLLAEIQRLGISVETWRNFQQYRKVENFDECSILEMGIAGLFFNRTNFSGILKANPIGGMSQESKYSIDCRFNKERICKLIQDISYLRDRVTILHGDALEILENEISLRRGNTFFYVDPPYYAKGKSLYRYWHEREDHEKLANILKRFKKPWLLSYDEHPEIIKLYKSKIRNQEHIHLDYHISGYQKRHPEILFSNRIIPPWTIRKLNEESS